MENNNGQPVSAASEKKPKASPIKDCLSDFSAEGGSASSGDFYGINLEKLEIKIEDMFKSGVHFGHHKSKKNPKMNDFIFTTKNNINILDLEKTKVKLEEALGFMKKIITENKEIIFVGTKKQVKKIVMAAAKKCEMPHVTERWLGGTFTNYSNIFARAKYLRENLEKMEKGEFVKYTKFEQMKKAEELSRLEKKMGGIKNMEKLPGAVLVVSPIEDRLAIKEARAQNIPIVALTDSNIDPSGIDYIIPANEDAVSSVKLILAYVIKMVIEAKKIEMKKE